MSDKPETGQKLKLLKFFFKFKRLTIYTIIICLSFALLNVVSFNFSMPTQASSLSFNSGSVSLDKYYLDGTTEVKNLTVAPGDFVTVRLKYSNTSSALATNVSIIDTLPSNTFTYIPNTLKNCLLNSSNCTTLSDNSFVLQNLSTTPVAGQYGFASDASSGYLTVGKSKYLHLSTCSQNSGNKEIFVQSVDNTSIFAVSCTSVAGGSGIISYETKQILGNRYMHQTTCTYGDGEKEIFVQSVDNSSTFTASCSNLSGATVSSSNTFDLLLNRYMHQTTCTYGDGEKEIFVQSVDNSSTFTASCSNLSGATVSSSNTFDLFYNSNAAGYIEYQMKSNINETNPSTTTDVGVYGTSPSLSSSDFATVTDNMTNSLSLKVFCDQISPTGGERNLSLSDAELRAGQDFRCNYQAKICPIVFEDANANAQKNNNEVLISNIAVTLKTEDGNTTIASITTNETSQCFESLVHGRNYRIEISSPPTGANTTGGDILYKLINYRTSQFDALFGYSNGSLNLNVPPFATFPSVTVDNKPNDISTVITPIQVIDTRLSNPGWSLTATASDFTSETVPNAVIPVANAFKNSPGSVTINDGQTNGISIGDFKTISSVSDSMNIFSGSAGNSKGNYQIDTTVTLTIPSYTRTSNYVSSYIYTII